MIMEQVLHGGGYGYNVLLAYNGGGEFGNAETLSLRPHAWSHACTSVHGGIVTVVINGILTHEVVIEMEKFGEKFVVALQNNIILGLGETKFSGSTKNTYQSEATTSNLNIHSNKLTFLEMVQTTYPGLCRNGDVLSWSNATWSYVGDVKMSYTSDVCKEPSHILHLFPMSTRFKSGQKCLELCPKLGEWGRVPSAPNVTESLALLTQFRNMTPSWARTQHMWAPFILETVGNFEDFYTSTAMPKEVWVPGQPNGGKTQQCTSWLENSMDGKLFDSKCSSTSKERQCLCQFIKPPILKLRGLCKDSFIDTFSLLY